jgi:hypothetical protein
VFDSVESEKCRILGPVARAGFVIFLFASAAVLLTACGGATSNTTGQAIDAPAVQTSQSSPIVTDNAQPGDPSWLIDVAARQAVTTGSMTVSNASNWVWAGTGVSNGTTLPGTLGYEVNQLSPGSPAGTVDLAHSPFLLMPTDGETHYSDMTVYSTAARSWLREPCSGLGALMIMSSRSRLPEAGAVRSRILRCNRLPVMS